MELLEDGGRAEIVFPDSTLFREGINTRIKQKLLRDCNLHTIVRLPNGVFNPYRAVIIAKSQYENYRVAEVEKIWPETEDSWKNLSLDEREAQLARQRQFDWGESIKNLP